MWPMIIIMSLIVIIGVPLTLWWWKLADKWADDEKKRFKSSASASSQQGPAPTVVSFKSDRPV